MSVTLVQHFLVNNFFLETIKAQDGKIFHLEYHQKRYEGVLSSLGITDFKKLQLFLNPPKQGLFRCRVLYSSHSLEVTYHSYMKRSIKKLKLIYDNQLEYSQKHADRSQLDAHFAQKKEADDILIVQNNLVTDTSIANIALYDGKKWLTPKKPLLYGTTRARLLENEEIFEADIPVNELTKYTKVALLNAMIDFDIISEDKIKAIYC